MLGRRNIPLSDEEIEFLEKWLGKIIDRGDLLEEVENEEYPTLENLYKFFRDAHNVS